jgi:hypothetical protein
MMFQRFQTRSTLAGLTVIAAVAGWSAPAFSACAVAVGEGVSSSQGRAVSRAKRQAQTQMRQSTGGERVTNMSFSEPACLYLDDGTNRQKCRVELSFCTQPRLPQQPPGQPQLPRPPTGGGGQCTNLSSQSDASDLQTAKSLVQRAIDRALRQRYGASLGDPRVNGGEPACYYKDDGTNAAHCELRIRFCP